MFKANRGAAFDGSSCRIQEITQEMGISTESVHPVSTDNFACEDTLQFKLSWTVRHLIDRFPIHPTSHYVTPRSSPNWKPHWKGIIWSCKRKLWEKLRQRNTSFQWMPSRGVTINYRTTGWNLWTSNENISKFMKYTNLFVFHIIPKNYFQHFLNAPRTQ